MMSYSRTADLAISVPGAINTMNSPGATASLFFRLLFFFVRARAIAVCIHEEVCGLLLYSAHAVPLRYGLFNFF